MAADWAIFFGTWLKKPLEIAAANPSGKLLARAVGRQLDLGRPGHVLELGAGTGGLTRGLLESGCPPERLVLIEREPELAAVLRRRFRGVLVLEGDAAELSTLLAEARIFRLSTVVSSLPIKWFPREVQAAIVEQSFRLLGEGGRVLQITNALASPLPMAALGLEGEEVARIWLNVLPAQLWSYRTARHRGVTH